MTAPFCQERGQVPREPVGDRRGPGVLNMRRGERCGFCMVGDQGPVRSTCPGQPCPLGGAWLAWALPSSVRHAATAASVVLEASPTFSGQPSNDCLLNSRHTSSDSLTVRPRANDFTGLSLPAPAHHTETMHPRRVSGASCVLGERGVRTCPCACTDVPSVCASSRDDVDSFGIGRMD